MTDKAKELLVRTLILAFYLGGFLLLFTSCATRENVSKCVREQIEVASENRENYPGLPPGDGRRSEEILHHYIMYWCWDHKGLK